MLILGGLYNSINGLCSRGSSFQPALSSLPKISKVLVNLLVPEALECWQNFVIFAPALQEVCLYLTLNQSWVIFWPHGEPDKYSIWHLCFIFCDINYSSFPEGLHPRKHLPSTKNWYGLGWLSNTSHVPLVDRTEQFLHPFPGGLGVSSRCNA